MSKKCIGCGAILQSDDKDKIGYIRKEKLEDSNYCERCFKITNYGDFKKIDTTGEEYIEIYKNINKTKF